MWCKCFAMKSSTVLCYRNNFDVMALLSKVVEGVMTAARAERLW